MGGSDWGLMDMGGFVSQDECCGDTADFDPGAQNVELPVVSHTSIASKCLNRFAASDGRIPTSFDQGGFSRVLLSE